MSELNEYLDKALFYTEGTVVALDPESDKSVEDQVKEQLSKIKLEGTYIAEIMDRISTLPTTPDSRILIKNDGSVSIIGKKKGDLERLTKRGRRLKKAE